MAKAAVPLETKTSFVARRRVLSYTASQVFMYLDIKKPRYELSGKYSTVVSVVLDPMMK